MENSIQTMANDITKISISQSIKEKLCKRFPAGCPFEDYSLYNLLEDFIEMYSWIIKGKGKISLIEFIKILQKHKYDKAIIYGDAIINILNEK